MANNKKEKQTLLSTESYKGVRDFYPEDFYVQSKIFEIMRKTVEKYGYSEYNASIIEPTDLYRAKTGDEIVNNQTYSFTDRGGRDITLRPEMTPSVARMVAKKQRELTTPIRWYSIPNFFRYERPQRGRLREFWQLNVDIFGESEVGADIEIISVANDIMKAFGAKDDYIIRINDRKLLNALFVNDLSFSEEENSAIMSLIDRKSKMDKTEFDEQLNKLAGSKTETIYKYLESETIEQCTDLLPDHLKDSDGVIELNSLFNELDNLGVENAVFDPTLVRGFDYYNGIVFEVFDTNPKNNRSLFGGGRYDGLTEIFGAESIAAVGFGMGDVTLYDFLDVRGQLPQYKSPAQVYLCTTDTKFRNQALSLAGEMRDSDINVEVNLSSKKVGDQIRVADKKKIPFVICIGEKELSSSQYTIKNLETSEETPLTLDELPAFLKRHA